MTEEQLEALEEWLRAFLTAHTEAENPFERGNLYRCEDTGLELVESGSWAIFNPSVKEARKRLEEALGITR